MNDDVVYDCKENHQDHICMLRESGMIKAVALLTMFPNVVCLKCGELANSEENTCRPFPLFT
jgi:hypothetical protein